MKWVEVYRRVNEFRRGRIFASTAVSSTVAREPRITLRVMLLGPLFFDFNSRANGGGTHKFVLIVFILFFSSSFFPIIINSLLCSVSMLRRIQVNLDLVA